MCKSKAVSLLIVICIFLIPAQLWAARAPNILQKSILFQALKRVEHGFSFHKDRHPRFYFETVQPLYQDKDKIHTFFIQPRLNIQSGRDTLNLGGGYRRIIRDMIMVGANAFWDWRKQNDHGRIGVGVELIGRYLESRMNGYFGVTSPRLVELTSSTATYERVPNGMDYEIGTRVPFLSFMKIFFSQSFFNLKYSRDYNRRQGRIELKPFSFVTANFYLVDDSQLPAEYRFDFRISVNLDDLKKLKIEDEPYPAIDLKQRTLDRVERDHDIFVESYGIDRATGMIVSIGRGT